MILKIMLDTNILISAIFFPSLQTRRLIMEAVRHDLILCDYVLDELRIVVDRKFPLKKEELEEFFRDLRFELVETPADFCHDDIPSVRDQKDTPILAAAIENGADVFVTGDKDFLVLDLPTPEIINMSEFLLKYGAS